MKLKVPAFVPPLDAIARETIVVLFGALLAALIVGQLPGVKAWVKAQWAPPLS